MSAVLVLILRVLLAASLYAFLGWAIYNIWTEIRINNELVSSRKIPTIILSNSTPEGDVTRAYSAQEITVGRDQSSDFPIANDTVSAHHARLSFHHKQWWVEDLKSTNGTYLNDERVAIATVVISGDELRCGKVSINITIQP